MLHPVANVLLILGRYDGGDDGPGARPRPLARPTAERGGACRSRAAIPRTFFALLLALALLAPTLALTPAARAARLPVTTNADTGTGRCAPLGSPGPAPRSPSRPASAPITLHSTLPIARP